MFLPEIFEAAKKAAPREMCGLIIEQNDTKKWILCENISTEEKSFKIDEKVLSKYQLISKILYVVHSHYKQDCRPSEHDKNASKVLGIPYLIVSLPERGEYIYDPH